MYSVVPVQGQTATTQELPSEINGKKAQAGATTLSAGNARYPKRNFRLDH